MRDRIANVYRPIAISDFVVGRRTGQFTLIALVLRPISDIVDSRINSVATFLGNVIVLYGRIKVVVITLSKRGLPVVRT